MKRIGLFGVLLLLGLVAGAQKVYFVYVQSDNGAPFYVRLGEKVTSSSAAGYVILSNLRDSNYVLQVGFPGTSGESRFPVALQGEDKGFVLKQVSGAWNLFDLQSLSLTKALAATGPSEAESRALLAEADPFTRRLVQASDDLTLLGSGPSVAAVAPEQLPPAPIPALPRPETGKPEVAQHAANIDTVPVKAVAEAPAPVADTAVAPMAEAFRRSQVTRRSESSTTDGFGLVFIDQEDGSSDTIRLLIPNPRFAPAPKVTDSLPTPRSEAVAATKTDTVLVAAAGSPVTDTVLVTKAQVATVRDTVLVGNAQATEPVRDTVLVTKTVAVAPITDTSRARVPVDAVPANTVVTAAAAPEQAMPAVVREPVSAGPGPKARSWTVADITCAAVADQRDFLKLRKNMAAANDEGDMVTIARKDFRKHCFTVEQVRLLGTLFLTDLGRYTFFEAAWGHLSDQHDFPRLESELRDAYLSDRLFELSRPKSAQ